MDKVVRQLFVCAAIAVVAVDASASRYTLPPVSTGTRAPAISYALCESYAALFGELVSVRLSKMRTLRSTGETTEMTQGDRSDIETGLGVALKEACPSLRVKWQAEDADAEFVLSAVRETHRVRAGSRGLNLHKTRTQWLLETRDGVVESPTTSSPMFERPPMITPASLRPVVFSMLTRDPPPVPPAHGDPLSKRGCERYIGDNAPTLRIAAIDVRGWHAWHTAARVANAQHAMRVAIVEACGTSARILAVDDAATADIRVTELTITDDPNINPTKINRSTGERLAEAKIQWQVRTTASTSLGHEAEISTRDPTTVPLEYAIVTALMRDLASGALVLTP